MKLRLLIIAGAFASSVIAAHSQQHSHSSKGPNGGKVVDIASGHLELTHNPSELTLYTTDMDEKPMKTSDAKGRVIIQNKGKAAQADLTPAEPNKLTAKLETPLAKGAIVVVSGIVGGKGVQARFTVD